MNDTENNSNKSIILFIVLAVIVSGAFLFFDQKNKNKNETPSATSTTETTTPVSDYKNTSYIIDDRTVELQDGRAENEDAPGSASMVVTQYFGNEVTKDLNGDGRADVAFLITQESTSGSGTFFYVVAALATDDGYKGSRAVLLGDRIAPQTTESGPGNSIVVNYVDRAIGEPMTAEPSVGKSMRLILDANTMQFGEVAQDFEGEADPAVMTLGMKTWQWIKAEYSDDKVISPKKDAFTLTFLDDNTFSATTDCNGVSGQYAATKSTLSFSNTVSTLMFCEDSQEGDFNTILQSTSGYLFTTKGELVLTLKNDSGSVYFR